MLVASLRAAPRVASRIGARLMEGIVPYLAITFGAIVGANARYLVGSLVGQHLGAEFPYGTLLINVSGSFLIGLFLALVSNRFQVDPLWRLCVVTGLLGSYTTFSAYTYEAAELLRAGAYLAGLVYILGSVLAGLVAVFAGLALGESL
jgi:CrcB protein